MRHTNFSLPACLISIASLLIFFAGCRSTPMQESRYQTETVTRAPLSASVTATGTIEPILQVEVGTQVSGIIAKIYADYNSMVKKGELLAVLDKTVLESELASRKSDLASSENEYEYQVKNYTRIKQLYEKKLVSESDYETASYQYQKARNSFDRSKSDLVKAQTNLSYATICSPIDGVVLSRTVDEGQTVAASFNTPTLFTIANDLTKMQVVADVDEADIGKVAEGQKVTFQVDAFPDENFEGVVTQVRLEPTTTSNVVTYEVIIDAPNPTLKLKPGLTANITIYILQKENVLSVPVKALNLHLDTTENTMDIAGSTRQVWVRKGNQIEKRVVETGVSDGIRTEILSGLNENDSLITGVSQAVTQEVSEASGTEATERSPFMPTPPGANRKNQK